MNYSLDSFKIGGNVRSIYESAANAGILRGEITGASKNFRFLIGGTYQNDNDLRGGGNTGIQSPSSANRQSMDFKGEYKINDHNFITLSLQSLQEPNHHSFYFPLLTDNIARHYAALGYKVVHDRGLFDQMDFNVYYQYKQDNNTNVSNLPGAIENDIANTVAGDLKFIKNIRNKYRITFGVHYSMNVYTQTIGTAALPYQGTPDENWSNMASYLQDEWKVSDRFTVITAVRFDNYHFVTNYDSTFKIPKGFAGSYFDVNNSVSSLSGGIGLLYKLVEGLNLTANVSRGFRQPDLSLGVTKFTFGVLVPSAALNPETANTYELGLKAGTEKVQLNITGYYTDIQNLVIYQPSTFNGSTWFDYYHNGINVPDDAVYKYKNAGHAFVEGIEIEGKLKLDGLFPSINAG